VIYHNKRIAREMTQGWETAPKAKSPRMIQFSRNMFRCGAVGLGIGLILVATTLLIAGPIQL
jgi:hypothetical protein